MPAEILTSLELAARLKANPETIRRQTRDGKLPAIRLGGEYRYDWAEVLKALAAGLVSVPVTPTEDMIIAGMEASVLGRPSVDDESYVLSIWHAMLGAAQ